MENQQPPVEIQQQPLIYENGVDSSDYQTQMMENQQPPTENLQLLKENELMIFSVDEVNEVLNFDEAENKRELSIEDIDNLFSKNYDEMEPQTLEQIQNQLAPLENEQLLELTFSNEELLLFDLDGNAHTTPNEQPTTENQPQLRFDDGL